MPWSKKILTCLIVFFSMIAFVQCLGVPVPSDKADYVGRWQSTEMTLTITKDGYVEYKRLRGSGTTSVNGPIKEFKGDDFIVGVLFIKTTFKVSKKPYQEKGLWKMVVDGVELTKITDNIVF